MKSPQSHYEMLTTDSDSINEKSRQLMSLLQGRHQQDPKFDPENPYQVFNETVLEPVETSTFEGIIMHNTYYDTGVNPEADTGPQETLVVVGKLGQNIINFTTTKGFVGNEMQGIAANHILEALDAALTTLQPVQEQ